MTTKEAQEWLCLHGYLVKVDGIMGPATKAALRLYQHANWLDATGDVNEQTADFLCAPLTQAVNLGGMKAKSFGEAVWSVAEHYLSFHPREVGGQNMGPWVRHFMRGNEGPAWPWCCGCVSTILKQAATVCGENPFKYTASCDNLAQQAKNKGLLIPCENRAGLGQYSIFLIRGKAPGDWTHTGVARFDLDHYSTIEGNSNDEGSREGHEMCARTRAYRNVDFIRI